MSNHPITQPAINALHALEALHRLALETADHVYRTSLMCGQAEAAIVSLRLALDDVGHGQSAATPPPCRRKPGSDPFNTAPRRRKSDWPEIGTEDAAT